MVRIVPRFGGCSSRARCRAARRGRSFASLLAVFALLGGQAMAQESQRERDWDSPWQRAPRPAGWSVTPALGLGLFRDGNVTLRAGDSASSDWGLFLQPRGDLGFAGRRSNLTVGYIGTLQAFRSTEYLNRYQQRGRLNASRELSPRMNVRANASYLMTPTTADLLDPAVPFAAVGSQEVSLGASIDGVLSRRTRIAATYSRRRLTFDEPAVEQRGAAFLRGGDSHVPAVRLTFDVTRRLSLNGDWSYTEGTVVGEVGSFTIQHVGLGWSYALRRETSIGATGGASSISAPEVDVSGWEPTLQAFLTHQAGPNTLSILYAFTISPAFSYGGLSRQEHAAVAVTVPLHLGRSRVGGSITFNRVEAIDGIAVDLNTRTLWIEGTFGYALSRWLTAHAFVNTARQGPLAHQQAAVQRTRFGIQFVAAQSMRIR